MSLTKLQQSQISGSLELNDTMAVLVGENRTLIDDLNSLRTQIRKIQGTSAWTDNLSGSQDLADIYAGMRVDAATGIVNLMEDVYVADDAFVSGSLEVLGFVEFKDNLKVGGDLQIMGNDLSGSAGGNMRFEAGGDVSIAGDLKVEGNEIKASDNAVALTLASADVRVAGDLTVGGNDIKSWDGNAATTALTLTNADVEVKGDLKITGNDIKSSTGATVFTLADASATVAGNLTVSGDLVISGDTTIVDTQNLLVKDPIIGLGYASGANGPTEGPDGDRGLVFSLGGAEGNNVAAFWDNSEAEFRFARTANTPSDSAINAASWVNLRAGNITLADNGISGSAGGNMRLMSGGDVEFAGDLVILGDQISGSSGGHITLQAGGNVRIAGDLEVADGKITLTNGATIDSETPGKLMLTEDLVELSGDLKVGGDEIKSSTGDTVFTLAGASATVEGNLVVDGDFVVNGAMTIVNTNNLVVKDAIVGLGYASGANGPTEITPAGDRGFVFSVPEANNVATFWDHDSSKFKMVFTDSEPGAAGINEVGYANFHAGIVYSQAGFSGSLTKLVDGADYLLAGVGITLSTGSNGAITISGASNSYAKGYFGNGDLVGNVLTFSSLGTLSAAVDKNVDVYLNGALLAQGAGRDVTAIGTTSVTLDSTLASSLTSDDVITVVLRGLV